MPNALVSFDDLNVELGNAAFPFVPPAGKEALGKAIEKRGRKLIVNSAYRTLAQQLLLFNNRFNNRSCCCTKWNFFDYKRLFI